MLQKTLILFLVSSAMETSASGFSNCEAPLSWSGKNRFEFHSSPNQIEIHDSKFDNLGIIRIFWDNEGLTWLLVNEKNYLKGCLLRRENLGALGAGVFFPEDSFFWVMRRDLTTFVNDTDISDWAGQIHHGFPGLRGDRAFIRTAKGYVVFSAGKEQIAIVDQISVTLPPNIAGTWIENGVYESLDNYLGIFYDHNPVSPFPE